MSTVKKKMAIIAIGFVIASGVVSVPSAAQALPSGCTSSSVGSDGRAYVKCISGDGYYRAGITCKPVGPFGYYGYAFTEWGNWARVGGTYQSVVKCRFGSSTWSPSGGAHYVLIEKRQTI